MKEMKITKEQIKIIHIAKNQLKISDDNYKDILSSFNVSSSKDLSYQNANEVIEAFKKLGFSQHPKRKMKYDELGYRKGYATPKQLRMIEAMWLSSENVQKKDSESLRRFIKRIANIDKKNGLKWIKYRK
jgi:hypothetical protein